MSSSPAPSSLLETVHVVSDAEATSDLAKSPSLQVAKCDDTPPVRTVPPAGLGAPVRISSESIPSYTGTPSISFKRNVKGEIHTDDVQPVLPIVSPFKGNLFGHSCEVDENRSPNLSHVGCMWTPNSSSSPMNPSLGFKSSSEQIRSSSSTSDMYVQKDLLRSSPTGSSENNAKDSSAPELIGLSGASEYSADDYANVTGQTSFATARAHSECSYSSPIAAAAVPTLTNETSQVSAALDDKLETAFAPVPASETGDEAPKAEPKLDEGLYRDFNQSYCLEQPTQSLINDISMMSIDENASLRASPLPVAACSSSGSVAAPPADDVRVRLTEARNGNDTTECEAVQTVSAITLNNTFNKGKSSTCDNDDCETPSKLNGTFDKSPSDTAKMNRTFDKETSSLLIFGDYSTSCKTPELDLQLDHTVQNEETLREQTATCVNVAEQENATSSDLKQIPDTREVQSSDRTNSTSEALQEKPCLHDGTDIDSNPIDENCEPVEGFGEGQQAMKPDMARLNSGVGSFLKRRCSILELSFVSSPKRANHQRLTPKGARSSSSSNCSNLINLHESIAFDFSAAAAIAKSNHGVAEMGSFVFATSSGQAVPSDIFDVSALEKVHTGPHINGEKYTRVSFLAMFDPIKPGTPLRQGSKPGEAALRKGEALEAGHSATSSELGSTTEPRTADVQSACSLASAIGNRGRSDSPLVKGLSPAALFGSTPVKPGLATPYIKDVSVQTDLLVDDTSTIREESVSSPTPVDYDEVANRISDLTSVVERQRKALATYEQIVVMLKDHRTEQGENVLEGHHLDQSAQVAQLKASLAAELDRNRQQDDMIRNLERSMHSTLRRMAECRESNAALAKVVNEQLSEMAAMRAHYDAKDLSTNQILAREEEEKRALQQKCQDDERTHSKAMTMVRLQLQAKESELESTESQLAIAKKEIDSLRALVKQMNLQ